MHVLLVEPHLALAKPLLRGLREEGIVADLARDADEARPLARPGAYDALLINWRLPQGGATLVRALRQGGLLTPVLMFVPSDDVCHRLEAVAAGADDCLPLPFPFADLLARLESLRTAPRPQRCLPAGSPPVS